MIAPAGCCPASCTLQPEPDGGTEWEVVVLVVVDQQWNFFFFPKAYAPGPSQLWLCSGTLFPSSCRPGRPALFLDQDFNTQWHCIPLLSSHSSPEFSSSSSPLQSRAACRSSCKSLPILCAQKTCSASPYALQGPCQGRTAPAQLQSWTKTGSCCVWKAEFHI